jgi:hypothetical protein
MGHTRTQADKLAETLRSPPAARPPLTGKIAMVTYLRAEIIGLQERGYAVAWVAAALGAGGFVIAPSTLKRYLSQLRDRGHRRKRVARGRSAPRRELVN